MEIWIDEHTGETMINPNVDAIHLPKEIYDGLREEIDKEILRELSNAGLVK